MPKTVMSSRTKLYVSVLGEPNINMRKRKEPDVATDLIRR